MVLKTPKSKPSVPIKSIFARHTGVPSGVHWRIVIFGTEALFDIA